MSLTERLFFRLLTFLTVLAILAPGIGHCLSDEEIFSWVADEMEIYEAYVMPTIHPVDKVEIQEAFLEGNRNGYLRWESQYGKNKADEIMKVYLDEIVGLFNEKSQSIFVGTFLSPCKQRAVLAHEFVHFYQYITEGSITPGIFQEDIYRMTREMEAYAIQERFEDTYCQEDSIPPVAKQTP